MAVANTPPQVDLNGTEPGTGTSYEYAENDPSLRLAPAGTVIDPDSRDFADGVLTVQITAGAALNDRLLIVPTRTLGVGDGEITKEVQDERGLVDVPVATFTGGNDGSSPLVITFNENATPQIVEEVTRQIAYGNFSDSPVPGERTITFTLTDGDGGTSQPVTATVTLAGTEDPPVAQPDLVFAYENAVAHGSVFEDNSYGPDTDPDSPLHVTTVNGSSGNVGKTIELESGALVTLGADGTYDYDPNGAFDYLVGGPGAVNSQATDSFTYSVDGETEVTVTVTVNGVYAPGDILAGTADDNSIFGTPFDDLFDLSQGGSDNVDGLAGNDYFYFGGAFNSGDSVNGGDGLDVVGLLGNYTLSFGAGNMFNVERLTLFSGTAFGGESHVDYSITLSDGNVAPGERLQVFAAYLLSDETLTFNGLAEKNGSFDIYGGAGGDVLVGGQQADTILGNAGDDQIYGMGGNDWLFGGAGADTLRGGLGADQFVFRAATDSTPNAADAIVDFESGWDRINLELIDASVSGGGDQAFTFIGSDAFSHTAGELRAYQIEGSTWAVEGDLDADGVADIYIQVNVANQGSLHASDFVL